MTDVDEEGYSCIQNAAYAANLEVVKYFYEKGLSLEEEDDDGENCFQIACRKGFFTLAKWIHKTTKLSVDKPDSDGDTPAHLALQYGYLDLLKWLVKKGASLKNLYSNGDTCLVLACRKGRISVAINGYYKMDVILPKLIINLKNLVYMLLLKMDI